MEPRRLFLFVYIHEYNDQVNDRADHNHKREQFRICHHDITSDFQRDSGGKKKSEIQRISPPIAIVKTKKIGAPPVFIYFDKTKWEHPVCVSHCSIGESFCQFRYFGFLFFQIETPPQNQKRRLTNASNQYIITIQTECSQIDDAPESGWKK